MRQMQGGSKGMGFGKSKAKLVSDKGPKITFADVEAMMGEDCDRNSTDWYNPGIDIWGSSDCLDNFFLRPADPEAYDPNS